MKLYVLATPYFLIQLLENKFIAVSLRSWSLKAYISYRYSYLVFDYDSYGMGLIF